MGALYRSLHSYVIWTAGHFIDSRKDMSLLSDWACPAILSGVSKNYALACPLLP